LEEAVAEVGAKETRAGRVRLGLQPHAPTTVALSTYRRVSDDAAQMSMPLCTHLAETVEERRFVERGDGPQRELLERLGVWDDSALEELARGQHPVAHLASVLERNRYLAVHVNDCDDAALETLARTGTSVAYCPRASEYFVAARHFGAHRYREMLEAGITVALGTDSIVNLPARSASVNTGGMSVLDEMRLLYRRDGTDPAQLLKMATINGAAALGLDPVWFEFGRVWGVGGDESGRAPLAGLVSVTVAPGEGRRALESVLGSRGKPELLLGPHPMPQRGSS
jgi:cytosine/adenosine deaminase-related metal-dependent hydrolase